MSDIGTPEPSWNPDAHLEGVYRRGRRLRARRRVGALAAGSLAVLVAFGVAAGLGLGLGLGAGGAGHGRRVATAGSATTRTTVSAGSPGSGGPAGLGGTGGEGVSGTGTGTGTGAAAGGTGASIGGTASNSPTTVTAGSGPSGRPGGGVTPTSAPHHATTNTTAAPTVPATTTTTTQGATTTAGPVVDCGPSDLAYSTATDRSSYAVGGAVDISLVVRNVSGRTCTAPSMVGVGAKGVITGSGAPVTTHGPAISCTASCQPPVLAAGQSTSYSAGSWGSARRGTYRVVASRLGRSGTAASFKVG
jgi:hypothetical protein